MLLLPLSAYLELLRTVAVFPKRVLSLFLSINTKGWAWGRCGWKSQPCLVAYNVGVLIALGFRKTILNSKCVSPSSKMEVWLIMLIFLPLFHVFLGIFTNTPNGGSQPCWGIHSLLSCGCVMELSRSTTQFTEGWDRATAWTIRSAPYRDLISAGS